MEERYKISDPRVLKVVAHPLRVRLLGLLRGDGPATASELGRKVGESSGSTSYHLRELFKYGFIEEDADQRDGRERRWRARHRYTSWDAAELSASVEGREALRIMHLRQAEMVGRVMEEYDQADWPEEWADVSGMSDHLLTLPPAALREFNDRAEELLRDLAARHAGDPAARKVHVWLGALPRAAKEASPEEES
ncbi:winged helix-turn-helix domain-containing protein [Nonomuraea sp. MCN248]|uniref:Winged helix-turn-helix domain-containing protein n=1 Tax=Nonomuraea corallina TaxID=2989783 RepID=A0ABT4SCI0_9ACTN|nr:winged helix-turn-helix domain-containing protein [Nonomuraea corallina]MDA0634902.1 winged helix-turn-helix domain-containing protein [Nonomuraea corallina]